MNIYAVHDKKAGLMVAIQPQPSDWGNWESFIGGGNHTIPTFSSYGTGASVGSIFDYFGLPISEALTTTINNKVNVLPFRMYNMIYNEWFRDENLSNSATLNVDDGPDAATDYSLRKRKKKHDYFTSALPWPQKGTAVSLPLGTTAPVETTGLPPTFWDGVSTLTTRELHQTNASSAVTLSSAAGATSDLYFYANATGLQVDLSAATAATINALRTAFQVQRLLERDARGGTRYIELIQAHFGVRPPDFRLQRPEYIGGGRSMINTTPIPQTSSTDATTPQGNLAGFTTASGAPHRFHYAATEHGYIIGLINARTDLTYQQGMRRHWRRSTRYDFYFPAFAHLGEQAIPSYEIYCTAEAGDDDTFGYQERWAELRYTPNQITGLFRSNATGSIDIWHYAEEFTSRPTLNSTFISDPSETTMARSMAVGEEADGQQILLDALFEVTATRPLPTYSVPGLIDHF